MRKELCFALFVLLVVPCNAARLFAAGPRGRGNSSAPQATASSKPAQGISGQSGTLIPDGRTLLLGGRSEVVVLDGGWFSGSSSQSQQPINGHLKIARAWHTATLLPDGSVLVLGGIGKQGSVVSLSESFDPALGTSIQTLQTGLTPRSHHTATLLTDGRLMVIGGLDSNGNVVDNIELWDYRTRQTSIFPAQLRTPRSGHTATLLPDGSVLVWGGIDANGMPLSYGEVVDATSMSVRTQTADPVAQDSGQTPGMMASIPADGATDVPLNALISFRFSTPLSMTSVTGTTIVLSADGTTILAKVVPAEGGMLAFVTPQAPLQAGTSYTATLSGIVSNSAQPVPTTEVTFTTMGLSATNSASGASSANPTGTDSSKALPPLQAPPGVTALAGQVLIVTGAPLPHVLIEVDSHQTFTDSTGRFLLPGLSSGHHVMIIDGAAASSKTAVWGLYRVGVDLRAGRTTALTYTIWMTPLDTKHVVQLPSPTTSNIVITNPEIPGLELRVPANTVITDARGRVVTQIGITPIPMSKPPFPLKPGASVPVYFTIQPGGASFNTAGASSSSSSGPQPKGAQIYYQNYPNAKSGTRFDFWNYDPFKKGWYVYGKGRVSSDKRTIAPDPGTQLWTFDGAMLSTSGGAPAVGPNGSSPTDGDSVDLQTGLFVPTETDLSMPGSTPLDITRVYRQDDSGSRAFGVGTNLPDNVFIMGDDVLPEGEWYTYQDLVLPDGGRIHFTLVSPCDSQYEPCNTVYVATSSPCCYGATLVHTGIPQVSSPAGKLASSPNPSASTGKLKTGLSPADSSGLSNSTWVLTMPDGTVYGFNESYDYVDYRGATPIGMVDPNGNSVMFTRDQSNNLLQASGSNGRWIQFTYDSSGRVTQASDNSGRTVGYGYDPQGRLATFTNAAGGITSYAYDGNDNMTSITKPDGNLRVTNIYDANDRVLQQVFPDAGTYQFAYLLDSNGNVTQTTVTDPSGSIRQVQFNSDGHMTSDTRGLGTPQQQVMTYQRQPTSGLILSSTDALGRQTSYSYDGLAEVTSVTRLAGTGGAVTTHLSYPPLQSQNYLTFTSPSFGKPIAVTDPLGNTTSFVYDSLGNPLNTTDPMGNVTALTYNSAGQVLTQTDPLGNTTRFSYDSGDLVNIIDPLGRTTTRFLDAAGRLLSVIDPLGKTTRYTYTPLDQVYTVVDPIGAQTSFTYYPNRTLQTVTDANQNTTTYTYNNMDRLHTRQDPLGNLESYRYDTNGRLLWFTDRRGLVTGYSYDSIGRRVFAGFGYNGSSYDSTISYTFDPGNRLTNTVDSLNGTITRNFDGLDGLLSEVTPQGTVSYTYDADERRQTMTVAGQPVVHYTLDPDSRLTQIAQNSAVVAFNYDSAGRRTSLTLPNGVIVGYGYDQASQLTSIQYQMGSAVLGNLAYSYDADGRRTGVTGSFARTNLPTAVAGAVYNADNQLKQWGSSSPSYDLDGNLLNDGTNSYSWNSRNQLAAMNSGGAAFSYDSFGRRVAKSIAGSAKAYLYDGANSVQELQGNNPTANILTGGIDELFARTDSNGAVNFLADALGSTLALTGSSGTIQTQYTYDPFGNTSASGTASQNTNEYTAREFDETGLYFYRARYYSPQISRFISEDPIGFAGGANRYAYAHDNPLVFRDPSGMNVTVYIYPGEEGNLLGHVAISINGSQPVGFDPDPDYNIPASIDALLPLAFPFGVPGVVLPIDPSRTASESITIETTDAQDQAIGDYLVSRILDPGNYHPWARNCSQFVHSALAAGGIKSSSSPFPYDLWQSLSPLPSQPYIQFGSADLK